jgi:hypothetical protein
LLRFFRINDPYRLVGLLVFLTLLYLGIFIDAPYLTYPELESFVIGERVTAGYSLYNELIDSTPPLTSWFYGLCDIIFGQSLTARHLTAFLILFFQSAFVGIVFINKKVFAENTYLPSLLFSLLAFISFDITQLTGELPAFGFFLLALNNLFKEIEFRVQRDETIANLGLFIGLSSLFSFSYAIYLPGVFLLLIIFTRTSPRKYLLLLFGFLLPHLVLAAAYYVGGSVKALWFTFYVPNFSFASSTLVSLTGILWLSAGPLTFLIIALVVLNRQAHLSKYQLQLFQALFLLLIIGLVKLIITKDLRPQHLLPLLPSASFFLTHFILSIRRKKLAELFLWLMVVAIATTAYLARYEKLEPINYKSLYVDSVEPVFQKKRVLILEHNPVYLKENTLATGFYNWSLCEDIFREPNYYENIILVHQQFSLEAPEVIVDPNNLMQAFFERLPALKSKYERADVGFWVIKN